MSLKLSVCAALLAVSAMSAYAKPHDAFSAHAEVKNHHATFAQTRTVGGGQCWVPERDMGGEYGSDTRGLGYWGSCSERGAVPTK